MDEARDLLRDVKRRRQINPHKGVLKKGSSDICSKPVKRLRFAEDSNEIFEIPMLDSPASRIVLPMPPDTFVAKPSSEDLASVDWIKEATKAVVEGLTSAEPESGTGSGGGGGHTSLAEESQVGSAAAGDMADHSRDTLSPNSGRQPNNMLPLTKEAAPMSSTLEKLRALAAAMPARGPILPTPTPAHTGWILSDQALDSLLWED